MKLNELKDNEGAHKLRMRVGRGEGSGKGKTAGRGVKGQKSRTGHGFKAFEGGQMPLHMRMPKRGFNNPSALKFAEVNLWRLAKAIEAGKLDAAKPIDAAALIAAGVIRREKDGVRLLGHGEISGKLSHHRLFRLRLGPEGHRGRRRQADPHQEGRGRKGLRRPRPGRPGRRPWPGCGDDGGMTSPFASPMCASD